MKNCKSFLAFSLLIFILISTPAKLHAVDISVGAATWYTWWDWKSPGRGNFIDIDPAFLYGPVLSVKFSDDFNLTFVYLYGKFDAQIPLYADTNIKLKRSDLDLALNYRLNNYFKVFGGIKYMGYKYLMDSDETDHSGIGPGLGLSVAYPLVENLFLLANISGMYLWGSDDGFKFIDYGINSGLSIAYYIVPASTVISLGGRFQYYKEVNDYYTNTYKFYGATLTATYNFSI